jgi:anti-anti-sigma factor
MILELKGELCVTRATEVKQALLAALGKGESVQLDLRGVSEVDAAGLQLLLAARKSARALGQGFQLTTDGPHGVVNRVLALAGLHGQLDPVEGNHG